MAAINTSDIVEIVMDAYHVSEPRGEWERVLVQGVFPPGSAHPPLYPGAHRNVVQVFFGSNMGGIPAFLVMTALNEDGEVVPPPGLAGEGDEPEDAPKPPATALLEEALFLRMNGERPPGHSEATWRKWEREAEVFLRLLLPPDPEGEEAR